MFKGVKVLSFTHFLQGPSAVQMLADLGADVVKIEPLKGAFERHWAGFDAFIDDVSIFFMLANRNQRSLSIDLRSDKGKEIILRMVREADVVIENYRPGVMKRLGFDYESLKAINPRLIYCSCTGYGSDGPYLERPGQDLLLQCMSGLALLSGEDGAPPTPVGSAIVDQHAAMLAAFGVVAAMYEREKTGQGKMIESNLLNAALDLQIEPLIYYLNKGPLWKRIKPGMGSRFHPAPYGAYQTSNGWIAISLTSADKLVKAFGADPFARYTDRDQIDKRSEIHQAVCAVMLRKTTEEWETVFAQCDVWNAPVNDYEQVERDPQVVFNKMIMDVEHPDVGNVKLLSHPVRYDGKAPAVTRPPPRIGEHTREVLAELGYSPAEIEAFVNSAVVKPMLVENPALAAG
jgi:crotonobetainyl-CoA:carnitine CoA-transferase CaiB-like acyl-CoA transferase